MSALTDESRMTFGKYGPNRGDNRQMKDVPAAYLHWMWSTNSIKKGPVYDYIRENLSALKSENKDLIWD